MLSVAKVYGQCSRDMRRLGKCFLLFPTVCSFTLTCYKIPYPAHRCTLSMERPYPVYPSFARLAQAQNSCVTCLVALTLYAVFSYTAARFNLVNAEYKSVLLAMGRLVMFYTVDALRFTHIHSSEPLGFLSFQLAKQRHSWGNGCCCAR